MTAAPDPHADNNVVSAWLRDHARRLRTLDPADADVTDLAPLREIVGDARVVAIGESMHRVHEFCRLRDRMLRFLVTARATIRSDRRGREPTLSRTSVVAQEEDYDDAQEERACFGRITIDPQRTGGLPCIRDLRIPVSTMIGQLAARRTPAEILADFPDLEDEDTYAAPTAAADDRSPSPAEPVVIEPLPVARCVGVGVLESHGWIEAMSGGALGAPPTPQLRRARR